MLINSKTDGEVHLVIGNSSIVNHRLRQIIQSNAVPILISDIVVSDITCQQYRKIYDVTDLYRGVGSDKIVDKVFVCSDDDELIKEIYSDCKNLRIAINVADRPEYCSFTMVNSFKRQSLEVGVITGGKGCKISSKIKRHLMNSLPEDINDIIDNVARLRKQIHELDNVVDSSEDDEVPDSKINELVKEFDMTEYDKKVKRQRWLNEIIEYYPLQKLKTITLEDLGPITEFNFETIDQPKDSSKTLVSIRKGKISLVGAGPGASNLLTQAAITAILNADLVLADKLVPSQVLDLVPKHTKLFIAQKFKGNAENAQNQLLDLGLEALRQGQLVVRLKQGDPYVFGRGGEEFIFFREHGYDVQVIPGITSALSAPLIANIPVTHRDVSDQVLICTGTGRAGAEPVPPEFVKSRTTVFLMALHRVENFTNSLISHGWPKDLPVAIVERANCPDQRIIRTVLHRLPILVEKHGSRPPGLVVAGYACEVLNSDNEVVEQWGIYSCI